MARKVSSERIAKLLNRMAGGGSTVEIAEDTDENRKLVWQLQKAFPLWDFYRTKDHETSETDSDL